MWPFEQDFTRRRHLGTFYYSSAQRRFSSGCPNFRWPTTAFKHDETGSFFWLLRLQSKNSRMAISLRQCSGQVQSFLGCRTRALLSTSPATRPKPPPSVLNFCNICIFFRFFSNLTFSEHSTRTISFKIRTSFLLPILPIPFLYFT